jgi:hypothetical protein
MKQRGNSLAGILIVVAIILIAVVVLAKGSNCSGTSVQKDQIAPRADNHGTTTYGLVKYAAEDSVCRSNLGQVRAAIQTAKASMEEGFPPSLEDLHLPSELTYCRVPPHEPYTYDPTTGEVHCTHPGHEKY